MHPAPTALPSNRSKYMEPPVPTPESQPVINRLNGIPIHTLDNDSLLSIFYFCRLVLLDRHRELLEGGEWMHEHWWYKLIHVCQRWRRLVLGSAPHLHLSLVCTWSTPVANMLAHSPPLPLVIDYVARDRITPEDQEGILLALQHRDRVRSIRLAFSVRCFQKVITAIDDEFPLLEYMAIAPPTKEYPILTLPRTFRAPHLRHLVLQCFNPPMGSPLFMAPVSLVTLWLAAIHPSALFCPNGLFRQLSLMPQLETLAIQYHSPVPNRDVEENLSHAPIMRVTLPNLRWFAFEGVSAYLEALLPRMTTPLLEKVQVKLFNQLTFSVPHLLQFLGTTESVGIHSAGLAFDETSVFVTVFPNKETEIDSLYIEIACRSLDWQVASAAQIFGALRTVFSAAETLFLQYDERLMSSEWHNRVDRIQWRELLRPFDNVETLFVPKGLVDQLSRSLQLEDGESPMELLPKLNELTYEAGGNPRGEFTAFIDARRGAGHPVTLASR